MARASKEVFHEYVGHIKTLGYSPRGRANNVVIIISWMRGDHIAARSVEEKGKFTYYVDPELYVSGNDHPPMPKYYQSVYGYLAVFPNGIRIQAQRISKSRWVGRYNMVKTGILPTRKKAVFAAYEFATKEV